MPATARSKSMHGEGSVPTLTLASGVTTINIPDETDNVTLNATSPVTIATINAGSGTSIQLGRIIVLAGATGTSTITFTNNSATTTRGQMDLDGGNITFVARDVLTLRQRADGAWDVVNKDLTTSGTQTFTPPIAITGANASALAVGLNGATNPAFVVDSSTASQAAGLSVTGATAAGTVAAAVVSSGGAANLTINAKGTGTIGIGSVSTGVVTITPATTITGAMTPTGGVAASGGFLASPRNCHTGGVPAILTTSGTNSATNTTNTVYVSEVFVPANVSVTGIAIFNGTAVAGNGKVALFSLTADGGTLTRIAVSASTAMSGTTAYQLIPLTGGPIALKGPATYFVMATYDTSTHDLRGHVVGTFATAAIAGITYATDSTFATLTPAPTTFTADIGPIASLY